MTADALTKLFNTAVTKEMIFFALFLILLTVMLVALRILFKRVQQSAEKTEERNEQLQQVVIDSQKHQDKLASILDKSQEELAKNRALFENSMIVVEQQQKFIESQNENRKLIMGMDSKLTDILIEMAKKF
ncbi:hypothetical protein NEA36_001441 [Listeria monocytogenes]|uniref:hypothetical protein n=1 Tax=Listeria monocytogenes TaxID=1639 RepID=UPI0011F365DF|nr:hypothetical protein [Listeria monocytogenes]EJH4812309.1 hypothetical protein [Listeria monocytogenes]EJH4963439.1 hypothetical protein [Listeria monocytogenes]EJH5299522.1 hypothetical protein [Listeria monocytogenes]EKZ1064576.1 hypothetical protein [Listeria monocytogenes]TYU25344.1 hypothetical protein FZW91_02350 [Listeria monocytogenes]